MSLKDENVALLMIDMQKGFDIEDHWGGNRNNPDAETKAKTILNKWREQQLPVFHIIHSSQDPNSKLHESHPGFEIKDFAKPIDDEPLIVKSVNSGFIGTDLEEQLRNQNIHKVVILGLTTNHCISTTTRMAGNLGFDTLLISDATATFDRVGINGELFPAELIHQTTLANLQDEFAQIIDTQKLLELV